MHTTPLTFDPRILTLTGGIASAVLGIVLMLIRRGFPSSVHGLRRWGWGAMACWAGGMLLSGRGVLHEVASVVTGNLLMAWGYVLFLMGTQRFYELEARTRFWSLMLGLYFVADLTCSSVLPGSDLQMLPFIALVAAVNLTHARVVIIHGAHTFGARMLAGVLLVDVAVLSGRAACALAGITEDLIAPGAVHTLYLGAFMTCGALLAVSLVVLASERLKKDLEFLSTHDFLTGALSRRALFEFGERVIAQCLRHGRPVTVAMLDLDHFKQINDIHGHQVGDQVLAEFSRRCVARLRASDLFGRYGGEEFLAIMPDTTAAQAAIVAECIRVDTERADSTPAYTVSVGIAELRDSRSTLTELTRDADAALYRAKSFGRNRVELA